jgi:peptide subunit release factor 1 (eRF1)
MLSLVPEYDEYTAGIKEAVKTEAVISGAEKYGTGAAIFWDGIGNKHIVLPSFPIAENKVSVGRPDVSALYEVLERRYVIGVMLVAWGSYALGMFDAGNLVACKTGTGYIHKKHKKGGRSQKRFARRTEEQKKDFLRRVGNRIEERFGSFAPDYIFFGGNRLILNPLIQESKYLQAKAGKISSRVLDVRYADREALAGSLAEITKSLIFTF